MIRITPSLIRVSLAAGLGLAVSACGGGTSSSSMTAPTAVATTAQEAKFGTKFASDYDAVANSEPANVSDGDIVPVSLTTEPIAVN